MNKDLTQIAVILDRSGSMSSIRQQTIDNFNEFINEQKRQPGKARLRLVQFDDEYEFLFDRPLEAVEPLNQTTFVPRGSTALNDAIGRTCDQLGTDLASMSDSNRPGKVVVLILTDGEENASKEYTQSRVRDIIGHQRDKYSWAFIFMGAHEHAILQAQQLNIPAQNALYTRTSAASSLSATNTMSNTVSMYRSTGNLQAFNQADRAGASDAGAVVTPIDPNKLTKDNTNQQPPTTATNTLGEDA